MVFIKAIGMLALLYLCETKLIQWMMIPVLNFGFKSTEYIDVLFLNDHIFSLYGLNRIDFTFSFLFMMQWIILMMIYNRDILEAKGYAIFTMHRFETKHNYIICLIRTCFKRMVIYGTIELLVVCVVLRYVPTSYFIMYFIMRHGWLGLFSLMTPLHFITIN